MAQSTHWLAQLLLELSTELDPHSKFFAPNSEHDLAELLLSKGIVLVATLPESAKQEAATPNVRMANPHESPGNVVSVLCCREESLPLRRDSRQLFIDAAYTKQPYRGRGLMRSLVSLATEQCQNTGALTLSLGILANNQQARVFWNKLGFITVSERMELRLGGTEQD